MTIDSSALLRPDWTGVSKACAFMTTRAGGFSVGSYGPPDATRQNGLGGGLNLGTHVGDDLATVARNRTQVGSLLPGLPVWLNQTHGTVVYDADNFEAEANEEAPNADASVTTRHGLPLAIMTADCLPVLLTDAQAGVIGAAHAGWRGLCEGVIESTIEAMCAKGAQADQIQVWLGAAIGPEKFEVGGEVVDAFCARNPVDAAAFVELPGRPDKYLANIYVLAQRRLSNMHVHHISGARYCTVTDSRFYSFRRDRVTGRMGCFLWLR